MCRIRVLPKDVVNKIAAGEVVERPASVVKELVENAVDAGAGVVTVEVRGNGCESIRVTDNGTGMTPFELETAILRHATSKIFQAEDLFSVKTLGFRGEALPSIMSVSRSVISSRPLGAESGTSLVVEAGEVLRRAPRGMPTGTVVEVADLFHNTPARKKFLKTTATEQRNIMDVVTRYALALPDVAFSLDIDGRKVIDLVRGQSREERMPVLIGRGRAGGMIGFSRTSGGLRVHGHLGPMEDARRNRSGMYLFVNGRAVRDAMLAASIMDGCSGFMVKGLFPVALLFLDIDPSDVDVNVHPAKAEVRFRNPGAVFAFVSSAVRDAAASAGHAPPRQESPGDPLWVRDGARTSRYEPMAAHASPGLTGGVRQGLHGPPPPMENACIFGDSAPVLGDGFSYSGLEVIGVFHALYILLSGRDSLYILDQHAAHERVVFERLRRARSSGRIPSQTLITPHVMDLTAQEFSTFVDEVHTMASLGFECDVFGDRSVAVRSVPDFIGVRNVEDAVRDAIHSIMEGPAGKDGGADRVEGILAGLACHASVRSGRVLGPEEIAALLKELDGLGSPATCPHGRPLYRRITIQEIERWLRRSL